MKNRLAKSLLAILAIICTLFISGCEHETPQDVYGPPQIDRNN